MTITDSASRWQAQDYFALFAIVAIGIALRCLLFNGPFGSDDVVYLARALQIAEGVWSSATYNGALRYGFNIPAGLALYLLPNSTFVANLWSLACSAGEIVLVYVFARAVWDRPTALLAATLLAVTPLHVAVATRIHVDPIASMFLTMSFVAFYLAETRRSRALYFATGLAIGMVFWCRELIVIYAIVFPLYALVFRRFRIEWQYLTYGGLVMLAAHLALMFAISGNPFHLFEVISLQVDRDFIHGGKDDHPLYYFYYLLVDIKHTSILGFTALLGLVMWAARYRETSFGTRFTIFWLIALLALFSFTVLAVDPVKFITKQSNYLTLFLAPLVLVSAYGLRRLPLVAGRGLTVTLIATGLVLSALEQQAYRVFVSNSEAVVAYAEAHPDTVLMASTNNANVTTFHALMRKDPHLEQQVLTLKGEGIAPPPGSTAPLVVYDRETQTWGVHGFNLAQAPSCWEPVAQLEPRGFGLGQVVSSVLVRASSLVPGRTGDRLHNAFARIHRPARATVYRPPPTRFWCGSVAGTS